MNSTTNGTDADDCELKRFEKNNYFHGKLMTARDMLAEQRYHESRVNTLARTVTGNGVVCGLDVAVDDDGTGDSFAVTVSEGLAFDGCGHPVVVPGGLREEIDRPATAETLYLYLEYDDCLRETVPVPGADDACEPECDYNRVLELFDVVAETEQRGGAKTVPRVAFPTASELDTPPSADPDPDPADPALLTPARSYHDSQRAACRAPDDAAVFLCALEKNGTWDVATDSEYGRLVYDNDLLYAAVVRHAADFGNPHEVTGADVDCIETLAEVGRDSAGNVDLDSPTDSVAISTGENVIHLDARAIRSIEGVENHGGNVDIDSHTDSIGITTGDDVVYLDARAIRSIEGVENHGGNVDLDSHTDSIDITTGDDVVYLDARAIRSIEGVENHGGNVDLDSPSETIDVGTDTAGGGDPTVELDLAEDVVRTIDALEQYVLDKTLKYKEAAFADVADRLDFKTGEAIATRTREAIDKRVYEDPDAFLDFVAGTSQQAGVYDLERRLVGELKSGQVGTAVDPDTVDAYAEAVEDLEAVLEKGEGNPVEVAVAQDVVCERAERLTPADVDVSVNLPYEVSQGEVRDISNVRLSGGGVVDEDGVTLVGISGDADGAAFDVPTPTDADFGGAPSGEYDADGDGKADFLVRQPVTDLRVIEGVGTSFESRLRNAGITDTVDLALADSATLADELGVNEERVSDWVSRANHLVVRG